MSPVVGVPNEDTTAVHTLLSATTDIETGAVIVGACASVTVTVCVAVAVRP